VILLSSKVLITGGAGFIGSYIAERLLEKGYFVKIYDKLLEENYGPNPSTPSYLPINHENLKFIKGDLNDKNLLKRELEDTEIIIHLASKLGIGRSMYEIENFIKENTLGTSTLLDILVNSNNNVNKLIIASSNCIYGEGLVKCPNCGVFKPQMRSPSQMKNKIWDIICPNCKIPTVPQLTPEETPPDCTSIYAYSKLHQEQLCLFIGKTYDINVTSLRLFNVIGARQALSNPYTGVCAIFTTSLLCGNPPLIYEDGLQSRDFVNVNDVANAFMLAIENSNSKNEIFNVGTGTSTLLLKLAELLSNLINPKIKPKILQVGRIGDVRNCIADISKIKNKLGFKPKYTFEDSVIQMIDYIKNLNKKIINNLNDKTLAVLKELQDKKII